MKKYTITFDGSLEVIAETEQEALSIADDVCALLPHQVDYNYQIDNMSIADVEEE